MRFEPSLPEQPKPAKSGVNVLSQRPQGAEQPSQRTQVTEQLGQRPNIIYIEGKPSPSLDPGGRLTFRWAAPEGSARPPPQGRGV